jgi:pimeloyl-ACP methyl ester carboxylesterase
MSIYETQTELCSGVVVHSVGNGPGLVLLHANGGDHRDFDTIVEPLAREWLVHAVDWPGHGSRRSNENATAIGYANVLSQLLAELPGGPFVLLGNSVGGFAAILAAFEHPELVRGLVLVSPGGFTPRWPLAVPACHVIGSTLIAPLAMRWLPRLYLRGRSAQVIAMRSRAIEASRDPAARAVFSSLWRSFTDQRHEARRPARQITMPVHLCWGRVDPVLPWPIDGRRAKRCFRNVTVSRFACGHQPFAERPEEFLTKVAPFLSRFRP